MIHYSLAIFLYAIFMMFVYIRPPSKNYLFYVLTGMLPLILLVVLMGVVGKDTVSYMSIISQIANLESHPSIEIGFIYLVKLLLHVVNDPLIIVILVAVITTTLLLLASKFDDRALFVFIVCIVPLFYLDMTMNGLRYGLSFAFAMLALSKFYQHHLLVSITLAVVAVLFHVSGLLLFLIFAVLADNNKKFFRWLKLVGITLMVVLLQYYWADAIQYLFEHDINGYMDAKVKYSDYKSFTSSSWYSGVSTLSISLLLLYVLYGDKNDSALLSTYQFCILFLLIILTFILAKFSYAGLRLQSVILFAVLLMMQFKPSLDGIMDKTRMKGMLATGYIGLFVFVKHLISTEGQGLSPFAPWRLNSDLVQIWNQL